MAEVLLDTKFWNKVFKSLKAPIVVVIKQIKGSGKNTLIPTNGALGLSPKDNKPGFLYGYMRRHVGQRLPVPPNSERIKWIVWNGGFQDAMVKNVEMAILKVAITESLLPESVLYDGNPVIKARKLPDRSTVGFGFVYFVRNDEIFKIGITDNLLRRMKELKPDEVLNVVRCSNYQEIEKSMHAHFKNRRIPQTEYFRLDAAEVEEAHAMMTKLANFKAC